MVSVIVIGPDQSHELDILNPKITYVKQVADIGDVTKSNTSYSWGMRFPKTPRNVNAFKGLGIVGDQSDLPYKEVRVHVLDNGLPIVSNGLLQVKETTTEYKAYIQDGIVDFYRDVSVDKISEVIDLSELSHQNTVENIIASFDQNTYRYVVASYNGPPLANINGQTNLNPFAMVPSINVRYLFDKILEYYGWTYRGDIDLSDLWMSYPNATAFETNDTVDPVLDGRPGDIPYVGTNIATTQGPRLFYQMSASFDPAFLSSPPLGGLSNASFQFQQPGNYRISFKLNGSSNRFYLGLLFPVEGLEACLYINGVKQENPSICNTLEDDTVVSYDIIAFQGTVVAIGSELEYGNLQQVIVDDDGLFKIEQLGVQEVDFSAALIQLKVKDFFKEILTRQALTVFADVDHRVLEFMNVDRRLSAAAYNWSDKYVGRPSEAYVYDSYARTNNLAHKYDQNGEDFNDGFLVVANENLPIEKDLYKSITHSPLEQPVTYMGANGSEYDVPVFKMFEVQTKEDPDTGDILADYKPIKNRFYIFKDQVRNDRIFILGNPVDSFPVATIQGQTFKDIVRDKYSEINQILDNTRIHKIDLALTKWEAATLDLKRRYYFEQEAAVYLLNSLTWKNGDVCTGEFIRLSSPKITDEPETIKAIMMSPGGAEDGGPNDPCLFVVITVRYFSGQETAPVLFDTIYTEAAGVNVFDGQNRTFKTEGDKTIRINSLGRVTEIGDCNVVTTQSLPLSFNSTTAITSLTCALITNTVRYHDGAGVDPVILDRVYGDPQGQNPFNGGNRYYKTGNGDIIRISESGTIISKQQC